ncbi:Cdc37 C terminal domain [Fragilaria crotonensis]|nr:Cdc37 C terminal domain [Fragilaria crotonensis]
MEIKEIEEAMTDANHRIKSLQYHWKSLGGAAKVIEADCGDNVLGDDNSNDAKGIKEELDKLMQANESRNKRLGEIEKHKTWNVDNICEVKEERTIINTNASNDDYTPTGFVKDKENMINGKHKKAVAATSAVKANKAPAAACARKSAATTKPVQACAPPPPKATDTYLEFAAKYAQVVEDFMHLQSLEDSKDYILKYGDVLMQENATNYILFACLEDEMNGHRQKMKQTCRQTRIILAISELAVSKQQHPGNVVIPFFKKFERKEFHDRFFAAVERLCQGIIDWAVTKRIELDQERMKEEVGQNLEERTALDDLKRLPLEERLGPGGLDPMEVMETLPATMQQAFNWSSVEKLEGALLSMDSDDRAYHMKRCVDSGLWTKHS